MSGTESLAAVRLLPAYGSFLTAFRAYAAGMVLMLVGVVAMGQLPDDVSWPYFLPLPGLILFIGGGVVGLRRLKVLATQAAGDAREVNSAAVIAAFQDLLRRR